MALSQFGWVTLSGKADNEANPVGVGVLGAVERCAQRIPRVMG